MRNYVLVARTREVVLGQEQTVSRAYGPGESHALELAAQDLQQSAEASGEPIPTTSVLRIEQLSTKYEAATNGPLFAVYRSVFVFDGPPRSHVYLTGDPATADALALAWLAAGAASEADVLPLERPPA